MAGYEGLSGLCCFFCFLTELVLALCYWLALCVLPGFVLEPARALCVGSLLCIPRAGGSCWCCGAWINFDDCAQRSSPCFSVVLLHVLPYLLVLAADFGREVLAGCLLRLSVRLALAALSVVRCGSVHDECFFFGSAHCVYLVS
jgi:hypothetical protein